MTVTDIAPPSEPTTGIKKAEKEPPTEADFTNLVAELKADMEGYTAPQAFALGIATVFKGEVIDITFPVVNLCNEGNEKTAALLYYHSAAFFGEGIESRLIGAKELKKSVKQSFGYYLTDGNPHPNIDAIDTLVKIVKKSRGNARHGRTFAIVLGWISDLQSPPKDVIDARLRLALLSELKVQPNTINVDDIFKRLPIVLWTSEGPLHPSQFDTVRYALLNEGRYLHVFGKDRFPTLLDYHNPDGVRIADAASVREGAHLVEKTTVMRAGFVNYNAGTLNRRNGEENKGCMIEGRVSQGVVVGDGSDLGGGSSTMGVMSGGGKERVAVGEDSLVGANGGSGFPLGDDSVIEAGLYVTAGMPVALVDDELVDQFGSEIVKAKVLADVPHLLFLRNSETGEVEVHLRGDGDKVTLSADLHANSTALPA